MLSRMLQVADQVGVGSNMRSVGSALAAGVKQLLPSRRETPVTRALLDLMDNRGGADDDQ